MKKRILLLVLLISAVKVRADEFFSTLDDAGSWLLFYSGYGLAFRFQTGPAGGDVGQIAFAISDFDNAHVDDGLTLQIYSSVIGTPDGYPGSTQVPGTLLGSTVALSGDVIPLGDDTDYGNTTTFDLDNPVALEANTYYWIVAPAQEAGSRYYAYMTGYSTVQDPDTLWEFSPVNMLIYTPGSYTYSSIGSVPSIALRTATAVPEPSTYAALAGVCALALGLGRKRRTSRNQVRA